MHFTENDKNTICIVFQFHNPKLSQGDVLNRMSIIQDSMKEGTDNYFCKAL